MPPTITADEAIRAVLAADYSAPELGVDAADPLGFAKGTRVKVETTDE